MDPVIKQSPLVQSTISLVFGALMILFGLAFASIVNSQAAASGAAADIGSFSGAQSLNDLVPLVFISAIVLIGVSLLALGGAGLAGRGPIGK